MRRLLGRLRRRAVAHPIARSAVCGVLLLVIGVATGLPPVVVALAGTAVGLLNVVHARRSGYCPIPGAADRR